MTRSSAEQEIRDAVIARLRSIRPEARICHEVNIDYGSNRADLMAVSPCEIIAVEIKSAKDKMDRAPAQITAMHRVAHHVVIAIHDRHLVERCTNEFAAHYCKLDGKHYLREAPPETRGATVWVHPEPSTDNACGWNEVGPWRDLPQLCERALPSTALDLLWRDELAWLCDALRVSRARNSRMDQMHNALRWYANGRELTRGICAALRARKFAEADPAIDYPKTKELVTQ